MIIKPIKTGVVAIMLLMASVAFSAVPQTINYQGYLTNSSRVPLTGTVSIVFSLYTVATNGVAVWTETQGSVAVTKGNFSVELGSATTFTANLFNTPLYLGVKVGADAEMTPRRVLSTVPYAFYAETTANGMTTNTYDVANNGRVDADKIDNGTITASLNGNATTATTATTATALSVNGTNCTAGNYPLGVDASGNVETCTALPVGGDMLKSTYDVAGNGKIDADKIDSGVSTTLLADGSVTNTELQYLGTVTSNVQTQLGSKTPKYKTAYVYVGAPDSNGEYTLPTTAMTNLATWCGTPSATNTCLLEILPGVYTVTSALIMQAYVDIESRGKVCIALLRTPHVRIIDVDLLHGQYASTLTASADYDVIKPSNDYDYLFNKIFNHAVRLVRSGP